VLVAVAQVELVETVAPILMTMVMVVWVQLGLMVLHMRVAAVADHYQILYILVGVITVVVVAVINQMDQMAEMVTLTPAVEAVVAQDHHRLPESEAMVVKV
jgi:uncharacterized membrane protein YqjE